MRVKTMLRLEKQKKKYQEDYKKFVTEYILHFKMDGFSNSEIASILNIKESSVKTCVEG